MLVEIVLDNYKNIAIKDYSELIKLIIKNLDKNNSFEAFKTSLDHVLDRNIVNNIGLSLSEIAFYSYLIGRFEIIQEVSSVIQFEKDIKVSTEVLEPKEAIKFFLNKIPVTRKELEEAYNNIHDRFFTITGVSLQEDLDLIKEYIDKAISEGITYNEFKTNVEDIFIKSGLNNNRIDLVYRNAVMGSYGYGRLVQLQEPVVKKVFQYWVYLGIADKRIRPSHLALNGKVFRSDDPIWNSIYPPWEHRCRCTVMAYTEGMINKRGLEVEKGKDMKIEKSDFQNPMQNYLNPKQVVKSIQN